MTSLGFCCACFIITIVMTPIKAEDIPSNMPTKTFDKGQLFNKYCNSLCSSSLTCPRLCQQDQPKEQTAVNKRGFLDGFTFDDYLFMRLLGRDVHGGRR